MSTLTNARPQAAPAGIDPRGPQFTAAVTAAVLATVLLLPPAAGAVLTAVQAVLFAIGAAFGVQHTPHALAFRKLIRPRLDPPLGLEHPAPPRFAQGVGLVFTLVALASYLLGAVLLAQVAIGIALFAALLNAVFRFCLGCEAYVLLQRIKTS